MLRFLNTPCNMIIYWDTMTTSCFVSCKDIKAPKEFQSSIVYKFSCLGCSKSCIEKTDRGHYTRLNEYAKTDKHSEIYKHANDCKHFTYITNLLKLNIDEFDTNERFDLTLFLLHNSIILDKAKHWPVFLFKEALAIHRQKPELNHGIKAFRELIVFLELISNYNYLYRQYYLAINPQGYKYRQYGNSNLSSQVVTRFIM